MTWVGLPIQFDCIFLEQHIAIDGRAGSLRRAIRVINQAFGELKDEQLKSDYDTVCSFWVTRML